ncbi:MAG: transporter [Candidatus Omnitrophica bacterium]|nr:transporter [Candidatus Omnitrophota bacterium]
MHKKIWMLVLVCVFIFGGFIYAQEEGEPVSAGPFTTWTAPLCGKNVLVMQPFFFYTHTRGSFDDEGNYHSFLEGERKFQIQEQLFIYYGLTDRLELDFQLTYQYNYAKQEGLKVHERGLADTYLFLRYLFKEEDKFLPYITGLLQIKFPTGKHQKLDPDKLGVDAFGNGAYEPAIGIIMTKNLKPFSFHFDAIYTHPLKTKIDGIKTIYGRASNLDFALEYFLPKGFNLMLEFNGFLQKDRKEDKEKIPASDTRYLLILPAIGWSCQKIQMLLGYQRTLAGQNTDANDSAVFTVVYTF